jgi:uncharacterized protein (DUF1778 family)
MSDRAAIFVNCSQQEARTIRERAKLDHRNVSSYVLHIVMRVVVIEEKLRKSAALNRLLLRPTVRLPGPRAAFLLRCSREEAKRIRAVARMTDRTISGFVLRTLRRHWSIEDHSPILRPPSASQVKWRASNWTKD